MRELERQSCQQASRRIATWVIKTKQVTLWCREVNDVPIALEHIDLLDCLDRLHIHLLQCALELLVICPRTLVNLLDLSSRGTFAAVIWLLSVYDRRRGAWARRDGAYPRVEC